MGYRLDGLNKGEACDRQFEHLNMNEGNFSSHVKCFRMALVLHGLHSLTT